MLQRQKYKKPFDSEAGKASDVVQGFSDSLATASLGVATDDMIDYEWSNGFPLISGDDTQALFDFSTFDSGELAFDDSSLLVWDFAGANPANETFHALQD